MNQLSNCPFCDGVAEIWHHKEWYWVRCQDCLAETVECFTEEEALESWNRRRDVTAAIAREFYHEVCRRAEAKMELTGRLEGAHYAAMQEVLREWEGE